VALDPTDSAAWNNLGCLDLEVGHPLRARARFREALRLDPRGERAQRNLSLVVGTAGAARYRSWDGALGEVMRELAGGRASRVAIVAFAREAPQALRGLYSRGAAISSAAALATLRVMGPAALVPLALGAGVAGAAWLAQRRSLDDARARTRRVLSEGRARWDTLWRGWLDGSVPREARDQAIDLLIENIALELVEREQP
jgi:hypothetical protein